jgi:hypothetical protein
MALIHGRLSPGDFVDENVKSPQVQEIIRRIRHTPGAPSLVLILKDGTRLVDTLQPPSDLKGWDEIQSKFRQCVSAILSDRQAENVVALVSRIETISSVRELTHELRTGSDS